MTQPKKKYRVLNLSGIKEKQTIKLFYIIQIDFNIRPLKVPHFLIKNC